MRLWNMRLWQKSGWRNSLWRTLITALPCILTASVVLSDNFEQAGTNDFQISDMDGPPFEDIRGQNDVVFNSQDNEYLAVWSGTDAAAAPAEIYGQRLDASGAHVGPFNFQISQLSQGNPDFGSLTPSAVYNPDRREYLVVWYGEDFFSTSSGCEIYGQRLAAGGSPIGDNFRISDMGGETNGFSAFDPIVVYNASDQEYLVVWYGDDNEAGLVNNEFEIFGQRLSVVGDELGGDFRISEMGGAGDPNDGAFAPDVAFDPVNGWYLVVWSGDKDSGALSDDEFEIYGQLLDGSGQQIGANDFLISDLGGFGNANFDASSPAVQFHPSTREWWVVWRGNDDERGLVEMESEIFGQRLSASGGEIGTNDFRISAMGGLGQAGFHAFTPDLALEAFTGDFVVTWSGIDRGSKVEIHASRLRSDGGLVGPSAQLSDMGPAADPSFFADFPSLVQNSGDGQFLVIFSGRDDVIPHLADETDLFGQRFIFPFFSDDFETGDLSAWSFHTPAKAAW